MSTSLTLNLTKAGEEPKKLQLDLRKGETFKVLLSWEGSTDLDLHALVATTHDLNVRAKVTALEQICSTYNVKRVIRGDQVGIIEKNPDGSFSILDGALMHSPDALNGDAEGVDESITIHSSRLDPAAGAIEIPLVAMIHPQSSNKRFRDVTNAKFVVLNTDDVPVLTASLSDEFGEFVGVQGGALVITAAGTEYHPRTVGFNSDFNQVIQHFA